MKPHGLSLDDRERRAVMELVDTRIYMDTLRVSGGMAADELAGAQKRIDDLLRREATLPGQFERLSKMAEVMHKVIKTLEPFKSKDRERIITEIRQQFLTDGELGAQGLLDRHIAALKKERDELQVDYDQKKHESDVLHLRKERPRYVRQLEWVEKTWGAVPPRDWLGTDRHKALSVGIDAEVSPERFVIEVGAEISTHLAWSAVRETEALKREMVDEVVPMMAATLDWTRAGCPAFSLTDDFFHALAVTDFGTNEDDKEDVLHMPFAAFVMNFPPNSLLADARRMFVYRVAAHDDGDVTWPTTRLGLAGNPARFGQWPTGITRWDFLHAKDRQRTAPYGEATTPEDSEMLSMARRILANMLSYIEASHGLPQEKHRHGAEPAPVEREHSEPRFRVGRTVKLSPQIRAVLKEGHAGRSWKLGQRFIVRGHWRNQAHGPRRSLRMRKWIEPFWKGPSSLDEAFERSYSVE